MAEIPAAFQKISCKQKNPPQPKQKRRNTVCFPGISAAFPPISAAFPPISAANRGVEKTENKSCRKFQKTQQIRKKCRKSKNAPFLICGRNFCRNESLPANVIAQTPGSTRISRRFVGKSPLGGPTFWVPSEFLRGAFFRSIDFCGCWRSSVRSSHVPLRWFQLSGAARLGVLAVCPADLGRDPGPQATGR